MAERKILDELQLPLATGRVRYVGEAVAIVVAESLVAARDAAEKVVVDYAILPAVSDVAEALSREAPTIWPDAPNNLALDSTFGDPAAVAAACRRLSLAAPVEGTAHLYSGKAKVRAGAEGLRGRPAHADIAVE